MKAFIRIYNRGAKIVSREDGKVLKNFNNKKAGWKRAAEKYCIDNDIEYEYKDTTQHSIEAMQKEFEKEVSESEKYSIWLESKIQKYKTLGYKIDYTSETSVYLKRKNQIVRLSDHYVPMTQERMDSSKTLADAEKLGVIEEIWCH